MEHRRHIQATRARRDHAAVEAGLQRLAVCSLALVLEPLRSREKMSRIERGTMRFAAGLNDPERGRTAATRAAMRLGAHCVARALAALRSKEKGKVLERGAAMQLTGVLSDPERGEAAAMRAAARLGARYLVTDPLDWGPIQAAIVAEALPEGPGRRLLRHLHRALAGESTGLPAESTAVAGALARSAWSEPSFRGDVARAIRTQLRSEVVLFPDNGALPWISVPCWWHLIAAVWPSFAYRRLSRRAALGRMIRARVRHTGSIVGWAGFWEQYLLWRAQEARFEVGAAAQGLPLLFHGIDALPASASLESTAARPRWRSEAPGYAAALLRKRI